MSLTTSGVLPGIAAQDGHDARTLRRRDLEQRFCALLNEKLRAETVVQQAHDEMMRVQGAIAELDRLDQPGPIPGSGSG